MQYKRQYPQNSQKAPLSLTLILTLSIKKINIVCGGLFLVFKILCSSYLDENMPCKLRYIAMQFCTEYGRNIAGFAPRCCTARGRDIAGFAHPMLYRMGAVH